MELGKFHESQFQTPKGYIFFYLRMLGQFYIMHFAFHLTIQNSGKVKVKSFKVRGNCEICLKLGTMCIQIFFRRIATHQYISFRNVIRLIALLV